MIRLQNDNVDDDVVFLGTPNVVVAQAPQSKKGDPSQEGHLASSAPEFYEEKPILNFPAPVSSFETRAHSSNLGFPAPASSSETPAFGSDLGFPAPDSTVETRAHSSNLDFPAPASSSEIPAFGSNLGFPAPAGSFETRAPGSNLGFPAPSSTSKVQASSSNRGLPAPGSILNLPAVSSNSSANQADAYINLGFSSHDKNVKFITPGNVLTSTTQETNLGSLHITGVPVGSQDVSSFENNRKAANFSSVFLGHPAFGGNVNNSDVNHSDSGSSSSGNLSRLAPEYGLGSPSVGGGNQISSVSTVRLGNVAGNSKSPNSSVAGLNAGKPVAAHNYLPEESVQKLQASKIVKLPVDDFSIKGLCYEIGLMITDRNA